MITDLNPGSPDSYPQKMVALGTANYFLAYDGVHAPALWQSSPAGVSLVKEFDNPYTEAPQDLVNFDGTLFFTAVDGAHGRELWKSDGTTAGTVMVKDARPGSMSGVGLWPYFESAGGKLYFTANDGVHGGELWETDGTTAGTFMVKDIKPGSGNNYQREAADVNGILYFTASDGAHGKELWKTDGTTAGTVMVKDINTNSGESSYLGNLTNFSGTLFFSAASFVNGSWSAKLWKSDGTADGTVFVKDELNDQAHFTVVNGTLFFTAYTWNNLGTELWKSDGSTAGTVMVADVNPHGSSYPNNLAAVGGTLYFQADDGEHGRELWKSDGTIAGTTLVKDIYPGGTWFYGGGYYQYPNGYIPPWSNYYLNSSYADEFTDVNGTVYFRATDGANGYELWQSDGTTDGTILVADIHPGSASSFPRNLTNINGTLYFTAWEDEHGEEPWLLAPDSNGPPVITISDVSQVEGNSGTVGAQFVLRLSAPSTEPISVHYSTADMTATAGSDYQGTSGTLTFDPGELTKPLPVLIYGDRLGEANERFSVNLSDATNATILDAQGVGTIVDDEPRISIGDTSRGEGNIGQTAFTFTVQLSVAYDVAVTVDYATAGGSATAGSDFQAASGTLTIPAGQTTGTITILVNGDRLPEANEVFSVNLSNPLNAGIADGQGVATIMDDEPRISISDVSKTEGKRGQTTSFTFTVTLSAAYDQPVSMSFRTVDGTAKTSNNDYVAKTGTLTFAPGETSKTITITVNGDNKREADEMFYVDLSGLSSNSLFTKSRGVGTILNDD
jgi:ELWxxDGT repeat protein